MGSGERHERVDYFLILLIWNNIYIFDHCRGLREREREREKRERERERERERSVK
jgi:hypothetical protein